jgi:mono/diheme cytochrome c family protein
MKTTHVIAWLWMCATAAAGSAWGQVPASLVEQGRALYFGTQPFSKAPQIAGASLPAGASACVSCHGALGAGTREGVQAAPGITLRTAAESNRWLVAAMQSKTLMNRALNTSMPRYMLNPEEQAALAAYAPLLGSAADTVRGVSFNEIVFGVYMPEKVNAQVGANIHAGVNLAFANANSQGGVHGRKLRAIAVRNPEEARSVFALVGSLYQDNAIEESLAAYRLPSMAALTLSMQSVKASGWTAPLLPSLQEQAQLMLRTLHARSVELGCTPWVIDTLQVLNAQNPAIGAVQLFTSTEAASSATRPARLCLGILATEASSTKILEALVDGDQPLALLISLAALGNTSTHSSHTLHLQVLPAPPAIATHADVAGQSMWTSLGEAAGNAVVEAVARSGSRLQPEIALARLRELSGYAPLAGAPLAWRGTRAHGWQPTIWTVSADLVGLRQSPSLPGEQR